MVGWLRNPPRKPWSLCMPYQDGTEISPLYPDFLFFRKIGPDIVVDLLDPHSEALADAPAKAQGLARYADRHGLHFGRIQLISVKKDKIRRLEMTDANVRDSVLLCNSSALLENLFDQHG